ncbi:MAG: hypothetical protein HY290_02025 [Planctomycetia bacterium]|nr:hypothetical protein [Planctomycetia bacterium]
MHPFKAFRKHQKLLLAAVTLMAMIAFGLGDVLRQMGNPNRGTREGQVIFETNIGNLTDFTIHQMASERRAVHRFIASAYSTANPRLGSPQFANMVVRQFGFGGVSETDMLYRWLFRHEADRMGITVSNSQIQEYINNCTVNGLAEFLGAGNGKKLTPKQFQQVVSEMQLSQKQIYDLLRDELEVVTAYRLTYPALAPSPEKYWQYFEQLNTREKIAVAAVPVNSFIDKTGEPTDAEIASLFEKHRYEGEAAFNSEFRPGFRQPQRVKLQYIEVGYDQAEEKVKSESPITDKDIEDYYESNKATTFWMQERPAPPLDDKTPIDPEIAPEDDGEATPEHGPSEGPKLDQSQKGDKDAKPDDGPAKPQSEDGAKSEDKKPDVKEPDVNEKDAQPECTPGSDDKDSQDGEKDKSDQSQEKPAKKGELAADDPKPQPGEETATEKGDPGTDAPAEKDADGKDADAKTKPPAPEVKFKPLDDDLQDRIRRTILADRVAESMKATAANIREAINLVSESFATTGVKLVDPDAKQAAELETRAAAEMRKIADRFGMKYGETPLVTAGELSETPGIGRAYDPNSQMSMRGEMTTIMEQALRMDRLCQVFESETFGIARYLSWKVRDVETHVPDLKEAGIREQVVAAWKKLKAAPLARERAEMLAQQVRQSDKEFSAALADETVTGTSVGPALTAFISGEFSFWQESMVPNPMAMTRQTQVQLGNPSGVVNPGRQFMQVAFEQLSEGEVGIAPNDDASIYYVVKVLSRRPADREEFKTARLFDRSSAYASILQHELRYTMQQHDERVKDKYAIRMKDLPKYRARHVNYDEE